MDLQPLYDIKGELERSALAGTRLLEGDLRLARAAWALQPLAGRNPVCAKIESALRALPGVPLPARGTALLDLLSLVDAVLYTQAKADASGGLSPLPAGYGVYREIPYGQLQPVLMALTSTGTTRMETVRDTWEAHPEWFSDYRILPALVANLKDNYAAIADLSAAILSQIGAPVLPLLKQGFDPAGKQDMTRRVGVVAAIEKDAAFPWLRKALPASRSGVRAAIFRALGQGPRNTTLLLKHAGTERGPCRVAVLEALALRDGKNVRAFWARELAKTPGFVDYLCPASSGWASDFVAEGLQIRLKTVLRKSRGSGRVEKSDQADLFRWCAAAPLKTSAAMLRFWRRAANRMPEIEKLKTHVGQPLYLDRELTDRLLDSVCGTGPGPLCRLCPSLFRAHSGQTRYLPHALIAALFTRPAAEVYEEFSPYLRTDVPPPEDAVSQRLLQDALLSALNRVWRGKDGVFRVDKGHPLAEPLDPRWIRRMTQAVWKTDGHQRAINPAIYWEAVEQYDILLVRLADPSDAQVRAWMAPYLHARLLEKGAPYTYTRWLLSFGGSPRDALGAALAKNISANRLYELHELLLAVAEALPVEEAVAVLEETLASPGLRPDTETRLQVVIPYSIERLQTGGPFPTWSDWYHMMKLL